MAARDRPPVSMNRILILRGGAIGDFVLTLPALKLLRDRFPKAHLEILGYPQIAVLAERRFYADAIRSIESASLAKFFAKDAELPAERVRYFAGFDLIVSYLYDPEGILENNLKRCGGATLLSGPSKLDNSAHAACQLARPLEALGLHLEDPAAFIYPIEEDRDLARRYLEDLSKPVIALHPGSGSETKNWTIEKWIELGGLLFSAGYALLVIAGEADAQRVRTLEAAWGGKPVRFVKHQPLPQLAALFEGGLFVGHDSGISHIAAAAGARCILLFGWTDPAIWAPANKDVTVLKARNGKLDELDAVSVFAAVKVSAGSERATS
jgi:heptosyltransferase-2